MPTTMFGPRYGRLLLTSAFGGVLLLAAGCQDLKIEDARDSEYDRKKEQFGNVEGGLLDGLGIPFVGDPDARGSGGSAGIGVNSFLWRASLDTMSFLPLSSADPFGGVIITDWYSPPEVPSERFKMTVYILDRQLRADGVKVSVFRQRLAAGDRWVDGEVGQGTATELENAILTRARELRSKTVPE